MLRHQSPLIIAWRLQLKRIVTTSSAHRWLAVRLTVSAGLVILLLATADINRVTEILSSVRPLPLLAAGGLFLFGTILSACRWRLVLSTGNTERPPIHVLTGIMLVGMFFNLFLPSTVGGDVVRAEMTKSWAGGRIESYSCVLFDRFVAFNSILLISCSAAVAALPLLGWFELHVLAIWLVFLLGGAGFVATILWFPILRAPYWARRGALGRLCGSLEQARSAVRNYITNFSLVGRVFLLAIAVQVTAMILPVWLLAGALRLEVPLAYHLIAVPIIELIALMPVSFNGLGLRESAYVILYAGVSVLPEAAIALSFSYAALLFAFGLVGGLCWLWPGLYGGAGLSHLAATTTGD